MLWSWLQVFASWSVKATCLWRLLLIWWSSRNYLLQLFSSTSCEIVKECLYLYRQTKSTPTIQLKKWAWRKHILSVSRIYLHGDMGQCYGCFLTSVFIQYILALWHCHLSTYDNTSYFTIAILYISIISWLPGDYLRLFESIITAEF